MRRYGCPSQKRPIVSRQANERRNWMDKVESLNHTKWDCKYHVVFIPKNRRKVLYGQLRGHLGEVFRGLAQHKESRIEEGHLMADHVHLMISIPPKYAVSLRGGLHQGEKCDSVGQSEWRAQEELCRTKLLGARVLCIDGRAGRGSDPQLHTAPRARGREIRPARAVEVSCHRSGGARKELGPR